MQTSTTCFKQCFPKIIHIVLVIELTHSLRHERCQDLANSDQRRLQRSRIREPSLSNEQDLHAYKLVTWGVIESAGSDVTRHVPDACMMKTENKEMLKHTLTRNK
jgi:hypothetical protein